MKKPIKDVKIGDKILGTDNKWHRVIDVTDIKEAKNMFEIEFSNGKVKCADTHLWNIYIENKMYIIDAEGLFQGFDFYKNRHIGTINGPIIINIKRIEPMLVKCITTDAKDNQFAIYPTTD